MGPHHCGVVAVVGGGGYSSSGGISRWSHITADDAVLSLSSEAVGIPAAVASADGATSLLTTRCCRCRRRRWVFQQRWHQPMEPHHC